MQMRSSHVKSCTMHAYVYHLLPILHKYIYIYTIYYCYFSYFTIILFDKTLVNVGRRGPKQAKPKTVWKFLQRKKHWVPTCGNVGSSDPFPIRQIRMPIVHCNMVVGDARPAELGGASTPQQCVKGLKGPSKGSCKDCEAAFSKVVGCKPQGLPVGNGLVALFWGDRQFTADPILRHCCPLPAIHTILRDKTATLTDSPDTTVSYLKTS